MIYAIVLIAIVALDQITKIIAAIQPADWKGVELIPGYLKLEYVENDGAAFGMGGDTPWAQAFFAVLTCVILPVLFIVFLRLKNDRKWLKTTIILIIAGTLGNFIDRLSFKYVVDFLYMNLVVVPEYVCNVADIALTVGAIMLIVWFLFLDNEAIIPVKKWAKKNKEASESNG